MGARGNTRGSRGFVDFGTQPFVGLFHDEGLCTLHSSDYRAIGKARLYDVSMTTRFVDSVSLWDK